jgi:SPP1 family predicted phage head-tail adaptor
MMFREPKKTLSTQLNKRVQIQTVQSVSDGEGGFTDTWTPIKNQDETIKLFWAGIQPIKATQQAEYKSINVDATHLIKLRGAVAVNEKDRIVYGTRIFEILTIENIQERGVLKLCTCLERR